ncbi:DUF3958 family protein [Carnobacterium divergens]|uniref:Uncharacterized protein n=1 Tax=Carnobacterium divergens DSM 20623 TaxID=1449336 RepID=A0A0R2HZ11_CARDV|nr:DUF3958 family protein [Carnobacterium divergens]KRN57678.1 hypothetical protein IV74_GL001626 [Carnobacterium divergens DSM 20623]MDO0875823.1 DUF3958 family protein [Carnobacterium divergens]SUX16429.1 Uncharacterised protein [Carnobacterium divergens]
MSSSTDTKLDAINQKIRYIQEDLDDNRRKLSKQEQIEQESQIIFSKSKELFDEFQYTWRKDNTMSNLINDLQDEAAHLNYKNEFDLEDKRQILKNEKNQLENKEQTCYEERKAINLGGDDSWD